MPFRQDALVALGANLPMGQRPPAETLVAALADLASGPLQLRAVSRFFATPCFPLNSGPDYVNAAATFAVSDAMTPDDVLQVLHEVEARFGRERAQRWGMRTLDLDLIALGQCVAPDDATQTAWRDLPLETQKTDAPGQLILPHPRLQDRGFVLVPLADIAPGWTHPLTGRNVRQMLGDLPPEDRADITPL